MAQILDIDQIKIGDEIFTGIGYQGLLTVNTKTYVEEPTRANDGSMPNIEDYDTFIVPQATVNFKLFKLEDYQRLCRVITKSNQFPVTYYDKDFGEFVTHLMYCKPDQMRKLFNVGQRIIGVLDYEIQFVGTLNRLADYTVTYYLNASVSDSSTLSVATYKWGYSTVIMTGEELTAKANQQGLSLPSGTFLKWNTKRDGSGINYYPNENASVLENLNLYAQWGD